MKKPDKMLRHHGLKELEVHVKTLQRVLLFHPEDLVQELPPKYCICNKEKPAKMSENCFDVQCGKCYEWFHSDCVPFPKKFDKERDEFTCDWCARDPDAKGFQRWTYKRKLPKKRHLNDRPIAKGAKAGGEVPVRYTCPPLWADIKVMVREQARRIAVEKNKLKEQAQEIIEGGGHHLVDTQGMEGLEPADNDDALVDQLLEDGIMELEDEDSDDE